MSSIRRSSRLRQKVTSPPRQSPPSPQRHRYMNIVDPDTDDENENTLNFDNNNNNNQQQQQQQQRYMNIVDPDIDTEKVNTSINDLSQEFNKLSQESKITQPNKRQNTTPIDNNSDVTVAKKICNNKTTDIDTEVTIQEVEEINVSNQDLDKLYEEIDDIAMGLDNIDDNHYDKNNAISVKEQRIELTTKLSQASKTSWVEVCLSQEKKDTESIDTTNSTAINIDSDVVACQDTTTVMETNSIVVESFKTPVVPVLQPRVAPSHSRSKSKHSSSSRYSSSSSSSRSSSSSSSINSKTSSGRSISAGSKKFSKQDTRTRVIQMGLKTLLKIENSSSEKYQIYLKIINIVKKISEWRVEASIFTEFCINHKNGKVLNLITTKKAVPVISNCFKILIKDTNIKCEPEILVLFKEYQTLIKETTNKNTQKIKVKHDIKHLYRIVDSVIMDYVTNFATNITTHGYKRLKQYIQDHMEVTSQNAKNIVDKLFMENEHPDISLFDDFKYLDFKQFKQKDKYYLFVKFFFVLQKLKIEKFRLVPIYKYGWAHLKISTSALTSMKNLFLPKTKEDKQIDLWEKIFGINSMTKFGKIFGLSLTTNGAEVSILQYVKTNKKMSHYLNKIENEFDNKTIDAEKIDKIKILSDLSIKKILETNFTRIIGIDPGLRIPFGGIILKNINDLDNKNKERRYCQKNTTLLYKSGYFRSEKKRKQITCVADKNVENITKLKEFNDPDNNIELNLKNSDDYKKNLKYRLLCYHELQHIYGQLKYVLNRWYRKIGKRRSFDQQANFLAYGLGSRKNIKKPIIPDEIKKTKNINIHLLKHARKERYILNNPDDAVKKNKTISKIKKEKKLEKQRKLANDYQLTLSDDEKKKRSQNRKKELEKKIKNKNLKKILNDQKAMKFKHEQKAYQLKKKNYQTRLNNIIKNNNDNNCNTNKHNVLILTGQPKIMPIIKGYRRPPLMKIEKKLMKMKNVVIIRVDEYRTTQNCSKCFQQAIVSTHGHRYVFCDSCKITWNRDLNAARNIIKIGLAFSGINKKDSIKKYSNFKRIKDI